MFSYLLPRLRGVCMFGLSGGFFLFSSLAPDVRASADCVPVTIGTAGYTWEFPLRIYYQDVRTQCIYLASEVGSGGDITELALNVTQPPGQGLNNWTIRMKHTTLSSYSAAYLEAGGWTIVYQGNEPAGSAGWRTFTFTTPFAYDGTSNLMVDFSARDSDFGSDGLCASYRPGVYRSVTRAEDGSGNPLTWSGTSWAYRNNNVPNIRLTVCGTAGPPGTPTSLTWSTRTSESITWSWTPTSTNEEGFRGYDTADAVVWTAPAGSAEHDEADLVPNSQYTRYVRAYNAQGTSEASNTASVYTLAAAPSVYCDRQAGCPAYALGTSFTFSSAVVFGSGGVEYYRYAWDRNPGHSFTGGEAAWTAGSLQLVAGDLGDWYLHLASYNAEDDLSSAVDFGPFVVRTTGGYAPGDLDFDCDVDATDLDLLIDCGSGPGVVQDLPACLAARIDGDLDVDSADFAVFQRCLTGDGNRADLSCGQ